MNLPKASDPTAILSVSGGRERVFYTHSDAEEGENRIMRIGILDIDTKKETDGFGRKSKYPNIACGKIYGYHKMRGDEIVYPWNGERVDKLYISTIFTHSRPMIIRNLPLWQTLAKEISIGGSGWDDYPDRVTKLPPEIEIIDHAQWTYEMYDIDYGIGFSTRGCHVRCDFCMVWRKEGHVEYKDSPIAGLRNPRGKHLVLMNNNSLAHDSFLEDIKDIRELGLSVHWDQANDITLVMPNVIDAIKSVDYRGFDGKKKQLYFAFDLVKKPKKIELANASNQVLHSLGIIKIGSTFLYQMKELEYDKKYTNEFKDTRMVRKIEIEDGGKEVDTLHVAFDMMKIVPRKVKLMKEMGITASHLVFYMLIGFNTTEKQDLERVEILRSLGCEIYPMLFRDLRGKVGVDGKGKQQPFHVRALRDWINSGVYRKTPFSQFERRDKHKHQREQQEMQIAMF